MPPTSTTTIVLRRDDFLALTFEFVNLKREGDPPRLVRETPGEAAYVVVHFPGQHVAEEAFPQNEAGSLVPGPVPVRALISGPSRLVFRLPDERDGIPYALDALLDWNRLTPRLAANALPPGATRGSPLAEPGQLETAIEFPTALLLSPDATAGWAHAVMPVTREGRTELWHTRLAHRRPWETGEVGADEATPTHLRALWSLPLGDHVFLMSLDDKTRHEIVRLSADFSIPNNVPFHRPEEERGFGLGLEQPAYVPIPVTAHRFMLTAAGAWANLASAWNYPTITTLIEEVLTGFPMIGLAQWQHIATMGRDQYVRTVRKGFLCPTGNRASLVTITERQFQPIQIGTEGGVAIFGAKAYLRRYRFIIVQEPELDYVPFGPAFEHAGRELPLRRIRITTRETPKLDELPDEDSEAEEQPFWPTVNGALFRFDLIAEDWEGQPVGLSMPLLFVPIESVAAGAAKYNTDSLGQHRIATNGQRIAFAPTTPETRDTTTLTTASLTFRAQEVTGDRLGQLPPGRPPFLPEIVSAEANVPAVDQLLGTSAATAIKLDGTYLANGFGGGGNAGELFLELLNAPPLPFSAEKAGGLVAPKLGAKGLSRTLGPVSSPSEVNAGTFDTSVFANSRLLGGLTLKDILFEDADLTPADFALANLPPEALRIELERPGSLVKAPILTTRRLSDTEVETRFVWKPRLKPVEVGIFKLLTQIEAEPRPDPAELVVDARMVTGPNGETSDVRGELRRFALSFDGILVLTIQKFLFHAEQGKKVDVSVDGVDLAFDGPLKFINTLKDILPADGFSDPPALTVDSEGVKAGYTLGVPSVGVGVFSIQNISLSAGLSLPFVDKPAGVRFAISERHKPFLVTVSLFGGGGFFALAMNAGGIEQIEASIEFGGNISLNLGIASGGVFVMAGIYFAMLADSVKLTGYLRCGGYLEVLGIISISVEFYLGFTYRAKSNRGGEVWGQATLKVCVKIAFISKSISLSIERKFAGAAGDPTFRQTVSPVHWAEYCAAFA